jgi:O-glycosyl hydrolase
MRILLALLAFCSVVVHSFAAPPVVDVNANGMVRSLFDWPVQMECRAGIWIVRDDWKSIQQAWNLNSVRHSRFAASRTIDGVFKFADGSVSLHQQIEPGALSYELTPRVAMDVTGIYWFIELPTDLFGDGTVNIGDKSLQLPKDTPLEKGIGGGDARSIVVASKDGAKRVEIQFPASREVSVQDARLFGESRFQIYTPIARTSLVAGSKLNFSVAVQTELPKDTSDATITLDPKTIQNEFDGFGGNFVYEIGDPTTQIALDSLKLTWARIGMESAKWEPVNDNDDASKTEVEALAARDVPGSPLRKRFELDRDLYRRAQGRVIASLWAPPEWMFHPGNTKGSIPRDRWDELAECVTSYLLHLKTRYDVEPALFSFNESDIGIDVLLDGDEARDMTKLLGKRFMDAGLRTKILLGDSADLKKGLEQIQPTLNDTEAMRYVGALAYHPWSGQNEHWKAWADVAEKRGLMLMAAEMGDDATGWQDGSFNTPLSTLRLARKYIEQLRDARTQVLLEWEWTGDYAITERDADGKPVLTNRGRFLRQLTQTTPTQSSVVKTTCDATSVTAAAVVADGQASAAIHLVNAGGERAIRVNGLPASLTLATLFVIDPLTGEKTPTHIEASNGGCEFRVPAGAIATLAFPPIR